MSIINQKLIELVYNNNNLKIKTWSKKTWSKKLETIKNLKQKSLQREERR